MENNIKITVYGADQICASCVGAPGSKDTYEWLQAAIGRKYIADNISYEYIDIEQPPDDEKHRALAERILDDEYFYPLVLINDEIAAEGIPRLKSIYRELDKNGAVVQS
ncbi:MAG TPA: YuzD family protein [Lentibacillus sp.]|uniref:YuzD family protein n=1 Tax=Lentibacillus sp. TaxID=1925746 RepID=UPI002B4B61F2|nr:YuzD family protein [Lentibacillus sp.]HLR62750.1 YuzD family protein [Lentibacillus sp.]